MRVSLYGVTIIVCALALLSSSSPAFAEDVASDQVDAATVVVEPVVVSPEITTVSIDEEVSVDVSVNEETGDVIDISLEEVVSSVEEDEVPTRFSLFVRGIRERVSVLTTFDPVKKAEKQLQFALERQQLAEHVLAQATTEAQKQRAEQLLDRSQAWIEKIEEKTTSLQEKKDERVDKLMRHVSNFYLRREEKLQELEETVSPEQLERLNEKRAMFHDKHARLIQAISNESLSPEVQAHLMQVKTRIEEHHEAVQAFQEQLREAKASGTPEAVQEVREAWKAKREEVRENTTTLLEEKRETLATKAAEGDEKAAKALERVDNALQRRDVRHEGREMIRDDRKETREEVKNIREQKKEEVRDLREERREDVQEIRGIQGVPSQEKREQIRDVRTETREEVRNIKSGAKEDAREQREEHRGTRQDIREEVRGELRQ